MSLTDKDHQVTSLYKRQKTTDQLYTSLLNLSTAITCSLCKDTLDDPQTLSCTHSFCKRCIDGYLKNKWVCPVRECSIPVTISSSRKGGKSGSVVGNPLLQSVVGSYTKILECLEGTRKEWWIQQEEQGHVSSILSSPLQASPCERDEDDEKARNKLIRIDVSCSMESESIQEEEEYVDFNQTSCENDSNIYHEENIGKSSPKFLNLKEELSPIAYIHSQSEPMISDPERMNISNMDYNAHEQQRADPIINEDRKDNESGNSYNHTEVTEEYSKQIELNSIRSKRSPSESSQKTIPYNSQEESAAKKPDKSMFLSYGDDSVTTAEATFIAASIEDNKVAGISPSKVSESQSPAPIVSTEKIQKEFSLQVQKNVMENNRIEESKAAQNNGEINSVCIERPKILVSALNGKDKRELKKCANYLIITEVQEEIILVSDPERWSLRVDAQSSLLQTTHVVCGGAEYADIDGSHIIRRTFGYLFALAAGLQLFNTTWLYDVSRNRTIQNIEKDSECSGSDVKYGISGCIDSSQLYAPQRSLGGKSGRYQGTNLFSGYAFFILFGNTNEQSKRRSARARQKRIEDTDYTKERLVALAQMCSAHIIDARALYNASMNSNFNKEMLQRSSSNLIIFTEENITDKDREISHSLNEMISDINGQSTLQQVSSRWMIDSIAEFEVLDTESYKV